MTDKHVKNRLLTNRGIGKKYHNMSLTDYPHSSSKDVLTWLEESASKDLSLGKGLIFFGTTQEGYDLAVLTARALILSGYTKLKCVSFSFAMEHENLQSFWEDRCPLMITYFQPDNSYISPDQYKRLENLLNYHMDNSIPIFLHIPVDNHSQQIEYGNMISPVFLDRLLKANTTLSIGTNGSR